MKTFGLMVALMGVTAVAHAMPVQLDSRTVNENGVTAQLVRFRDPRATQCVDYGVLKVLDHGQLIEQKALCGATNLLAAVQGTHVVFYVYAQDDKGLNLYRYVTERRELDMYPFEANGLRVNSLGTDVMVHAYYPQRTAGGAVIQRREGWTWRYNNPAPKPIQ